MPLPWKKTTKPNRISRIVSDLQPPSRAASLVVETGFPTSVVDLFVKNRDRLKKHSLKKTKHKHSPLPVSESLPPLRASSLTPESSPPPPADEPVVVAAAAGHGVDDLEEKSRVADVELDVVVGVGGGGRDNGDENANANANANDGVFVPAAKMFLAVVPVLSTKRLALVITLSAFLCFLLDILWKFAARFFNSSSIPNRDFTATNAECRRAGFIDRGGEEEQEEVPPVNSASINEIQIVESNSDHELQRDPFRNGEKVVGCSSDLEAENEEEGKTEMGKSQRSKSSKLKAKIIKKLIPKKLRSGKTMKMKKKEKKKRKEEGGIVIMENEPGTEWSCEEEEHEEEHEEEEEEEEEEEVGSSTMVKGEEEQEQEEEEEEEDEAKKNLEFKFVIVTILAGLCGGPFLALLLTVSGCFISKFIKFIKLG